MTTTRRTTLTLPGARFALAALAALACADPLSVTSSPEPPRRHDLAGSSGRHVVVLKAESTPADFAARVERAGGRVEYSLDAIGVVAVSGLTPDGAASLAADADVRAVEPDVAMTIDARAIDDPSDELAVAAADASALDAAALAVAPAVAPKTFPDNVPFYARQWNMRAIHADEAWAAAAHDPALLGTGNVVVAIIDTGIDYEQPEVRGLVDLEHSKSFIPDEDSDNDLLRSTYPGRAPFSDLFWHGTAQAANIASNATLLAGVASPLAAQGRIRFLALKVTNRFTTQYQAAGIAAVVYAADNGADIINVSGGVRFDKSKNPGLISAYLRALNYAWRKGALTIGVPGNDTSDVAHDPNRVTIPCEAPHAICTSATGPVSAPGINGPWDRVDLDVVGLYTGYGRGAVTVAAPGGQRFNFTRIWSPCLTTPSETSPAGCKSGAAPRFAQGIGTSFSASTTSGLAALLVAQMGHGQPEKIRKRIIETADDLGAQSVDPYYGYGRINVARALGAMK